MAIGAFLKIYFSTFGILLNVVMVFCLVMLNASRYYFACTMPSFIYFLLRWIYEHPFSREISLLFDEIEVNTIILKTFTFICDIITLPVRAFLKIHFSILSVLTLMNTITLKTFTFIFDILKIFIGLFNPVTMVPNYIKRKFQNLCVTIKSDQHLDEKGLPRMPSEIQNHHQIPNSNLMVEEIKLLKESQKNLEIEIQLLRDENQNLRKECLSLERIKEIIQCKICLDNDKSVYFYPCGHLVTCSDCARSIQECPICRKQIRKKQPVYLS